MKISQLWTTTECTGLKGLPLFPLRKKVEKIVLLEYQTTTQVELSGPLRLDEVDLQDKALALGLMLHFRCLP